MHLPVILIGLLAGPYPGFVTGLLGPLVSFIISGMPIQTTLPFMMIELCVYGLLSGFLRKVKIPTIAKVILVQIGGRIVRAVSILISVYMLNNESILVESIWINIKTGMFGIVVQWILLPLIIYRVENKKHES